MSAPERTATPAAQVLRDRAARYARKPAATTAASEKLAVLEFSVHGERYAFESARVSEFLLLSDITTLPCVPPFIAGLINLRGRFLPAIDLRRFLNLPQRGITDLHHLVVIRQGAVEVAVIADIVAGLRSIDRAALQPASPGLTAIDPAYVRGITPDLVCVLDAQAMLSDPRLVVNDEAGN